jgi:hypothetical protein
MSSVFNNIRVLGNLDVKGTTTSVDSTIVNIVDNFLYLNKDLTTGSKSGGITINYNASQTTSTTTGGVGFAAGTVDVVTGQTWGNGDFIQVSGALNSENNGLYQIISFTTNTPVGFDRITVNGDTASDYVQTSFTANANDLTATVTKVSIAVIQTSDSGVLQYGAADNAGSISLNPIPSGSLDDYLKLAGVSDGQTAIGGLDSGANLTLRSTSNATKGSVIIDEPTASSSIETGALLVGGGVGVVKDVYVGGKIAVDSIIGNSATPMTIGGTTSTGINLASSSTPTTVLGNLSVLSSIDTTTANVMTVGGTNATSLNLGTGSSVTDVNIGTNANTVVSVGNTTGLVKFSGSVTHNVVTIPGGTTFGNDAKNADFGRVILLTGAAVTATLPNSATGTNGVDMNGKIITIINSASGVKTIAAGGSDTIDGVANITLNIIHDRTTLVYENTNKRWYMI